MKDQETTPETRMQAELERLREQVTKDDALIVKLDDDLARLHHIEEAARGLSENNRNSVNHADKGDLTFIRTENLAALRAALEEK